MTLTVLGRSAVVAVMNTAELWDRDDRSVCGGPPGNRRVLGKPEVRTSRRVVRDVVTEDSSQARLVGHDQVVETFPPNGADDALGKAVLP
jgi:hypothetical protein